MKRFRILLRFKPYVRPYIGRMGLALLLSIPMAALKVSPAPAVKYLTDHILVNKDEKALALLPFAVIGLFSLNFVIRFFHQYLIRSSANRLIQNLRNDIYDKLLGLSLSYFGEAQGGALISRVVNDVQNIVRSVSNLIDLVREPTIFISLLGYAFYLNWRLALLTLVTIPLVALLLGNTGKHSKRYSSGILSKLGELSSLLSESVIGMRVIQGFGLESYMRGQFMKKNRELTRTALKAVRVEELAAPGVEFISGIAVALVLYFGGKEVLKGHMTPGDVFAFFACFGLMVQPLRMFNELNISFNQCVASAERVFEILDQTVEVRNREDAKKLPAFSREISFDRVSFAYKNGRKVLDDFSLTVKKGEVVALVGASGAGKSTVLGLLPRFFDPNGGAVRIDGEDLRGVTLESLRSQIALVTQEVFLFHDTVRANIRAGRHSVTDEQIEAAAKAAQAHEFIRRLPDGFDTPIGDRGQKLSGGERQRLSIARAISKDAPILLLDEATSALDTENERLVQAALDQLLVGRTALVVAHRLSTIRKADRILVMEEGRVVEEGDHESLLAKGGAYARALRMQEGFHAESQGT